MKVETNLQEMLEAVSVPADWVGIREVYESQTPRMIRDGVPVANGKYSTHGIMVEVLVDGQFGYYGTHRLEESSIIKAAEKACEVASSASKLSILA